jgi:hypothetical protein
MQMCSRHQSKIWAYTIHGPWDYHANSLKGQSHVVRGVAARVFCFQFCDIKNLVKFCTQKKEKISRTYKPKKIQTFANFLLKKWQFFSPRKIMVATCCEEIKLVVRWYQSCQTQYKFELGAIYIWGYHSRSWNNNNNNDNIIIIFVKEN